MIGQTIRIYKNAFGGLSREIWLLSLIMLINRSGTMVVPFMTLYLTSTEIGRSLSDAGMVMGLFGLGTIVGAYVGGRLTDKIGFYKVQLFSLFFGGILFIVLGQIKSFPLICLFTFLLSFINEAFRPANSTAIAYYSHTANRTRSYSLNRLSINLGWAIGASIGGLVATYNYEALFWIDGFTNIGAALLLFRFLKPGKTTTHKKPELEQQVPEKISAYKDKVYLLFIALVSIFALCFFQLFTTVPKYFRDNLYLKESYIGFVLALNGLLIVIFEMVVIYRLEQKNKNMSYIIFGLLVCALAFVTLLIPGPAKIITLVMILLITIGEIMTMPFMNTFWTQRSNDLNRGQYAALYTMAWGMAQTLGPVLSSFLVDASSFDMLFVVMGVLLSFTALGFVYLSKSKH